MYFHTLKVGVKESRGRAAGLCGSALQWTTGILISSVAVRLEVGSEGGVGIERYATWGIGVAIAPSVELVTKRRKRENILKKYPDAVIADVTSQATDGLVRLSPFYPHGGIPVPFSEGYTAMCVEAIWQGLKVFETADVDVNMFANDMMKNIKRTVIGSPDKHWGLSGESFFSKNFGIIK